MIGGAKGIGIGLDFGIGNIKRPTKRDTLDPAIKEALCGVWIADQNTNESPTRNIIKNKIKDRGGDFEIRNAAYKLNSGYGSYKLDFSGYYSDQNNNGANVTFHSNKVEFNNITVNHVNAFYVIANLIPSFTIKVKVSGLKDNGVLRVTIKETEDFAQPYVQVYEASGNGIHTISIPDSYRIVFSFTNVESEVTLEQIPEYNGAFVTDGVDDMIVSQKSVSDMLGGSNEITVVSMITNLDSRQILCNSIFSNVATYNVRNLLEANNVTTILGYTDKDGTITNLNLIMGDKNSIGLTDKVNFNSIYDFYPTGYLSYYYKVAWYWTFIAKRVLTTDEINQVIAYYNLDKYVAPDIYYDIKKQGITNENHAEFGDKLIDYSGNGKDIQLYNFGWKLDSGVGKYEVDFMFYSTNNSNVYKSKTSNSISAQSTASFAQSLLFKYTSKDGGDSDLSEYNIKVDNLIGNIYYRYINTNGIIQEFQIRANGIYTLPKSFISLAKQQDWYGFIIGSNSSVTITQLPSYENALVFDGVDDYGQYVGDLGLKDYTVVADRAYVELIDRQVPIISNSKISTDIPFIMEYSVDIETHTNPFSYGNRNSVAKPIDKNRKVSYQSTYVYNGNTITKGTSTNTGDGLTFSRYHVNDPYTKLCLYNFMLFPYSLSEFLIERQLKKRKLGTLHPVVKFNPIIEGNEPFEILKYHKITADNAYLDVTKGEYIPIGHEIGIDIKLSDNTFKLTKVTSSSLTDINFGMPPGTPYATIIGTLTDKSPQDIEISIENNQQGGGRTSD